MCIRDSGIMVEEILARKPVSDPHILCMGIGDVLCDQAPLQVTQFEADIRIAEQLEKLWLEKGGGGNSCESYNLPWYFAAMHTAIDCFETVSYTHLDVYKRQVSVSGPYCRNVRSSRISSVP